MDVDEDALRAGTVSPRLHGYLRVPVEPARCPGRQGAQRRRRARAQEAIAGLRRRRDARRAALLVGPGTTTGALHGGARAARRPLLGVDVVRGRELVAADADERRCSASSSDGPALVVVTPVGGQGFLFGRGNQQLSPRRARAASDRERGRRSRRRPSSPRSRGRPLLVDTGDAALDAALAGYARVVTGYGARGVYRVAS